MTRSRTLLLAMSAAALATLTACGGGRATAETGPDAVTSVGTGALQVMGFEVTPVVADSPVPTASKEPRHDAKRKALGRAMLRRNTLHAEAVVKTKDGTRTVAVQRGTVTSIDDRTVNVKSTDGFALTWTFGNPMRVVEKRTTVAPNAVKVGAEIGLAGTKDGATTSARLIVIKPS